MTPKERQRAGRLGASKRCNLRRSSSEQNSSTGENPSEGTGWVVVHYFTDIVYSCSWMLIKMISSTLVIYGCFFWLG